MAGPSITTPFSGAQLRRLRELAGLTQVGLIDAIADSGPPLGPTVVSDWETGRSKPRPAAFSALIGVFAKRLDITRDEALRRLAPEEAA